MQSTTSIAPACEFACSGHEEHASLPSAPLYVSCAHCVQLPPSGPVYPWLHRHSSSCIACVFSVCVFDGQASHAVFPVFGWYRKIEQGRQCCVPLVAPVASEPYFPAGHLTHSVLPAVCVYEPRGQSTHVVDALAPACAEYFPGLQLVHAALEFAPSVSENFPATQFWHVVASFAASCALYLPRLHETQSARVWLGYAVDPAAAYVPGRHAVQPGCPGVMW